MKNSKINHFDSRTLKMIKESCEDRDLIIKEWQFIDLMSKYKAIVYMSWWDRVFNWPFKKRHKEEWEEIRKRADDGRYTNI